MCSRHSDSLTIEIQASVEEQYGAPNIEKRYRVVFIGKGGRELATVSGTSDSGGLRAWTQPVVCQHPTITGCLSPTRFGCALTLHQRLSRMRHLYNKVTAR